jgi:hypothetical protein
VFCDWTAPADILQQLEAAIAEERAVLIILDPLLKFVQVKDEKAYAEISKALQPLHALARRSGAHLLVVHHAGKTEKEDGDNVLGSTAIFASFDSLLSLRKRNGFRMISTVQRYGTPIAETALLYDPDTGSVSLGTPKVEAEQHISEGMILEWLRTQPGWATAEEIYQSVRGRRQTKQNALKSLFEADRVERTGAGSKGDPYRFRHPNGGTPLVNDGFQDPNFSIPSQNESTRGMENPGSA